MSSINLLYKNINQWVNREKKSGKSVPEIMRDVKLAYLILVLTEMGLFILVAGIDILNNNIPVVEEELN
mgnify:CR=1 FL=1